jgi:CTP:phosphocholine cytidylyltransferase-like protein
MTDFNLSDWELENLNGVKIYTASKVEEFIRLLKEELIKNVDVWTNQTEEVTEEQIKFVIDKLAGEKLLENDNLAEMLDDAGMFESKGGKK